MRNPALFLLLQCVALPASASTFMLSCEGCSAAEAQARLTQYAVDRRIDLPNPVYAADLAGDRFYAFAPTCHRRQDQVPLRPSVAGDEAGARVVAGGAGSALCVEYLFDPAAPDPLYVDFYAELRRLHAESGGSMRKTVEIDSAWIGGGIPFGQLNGLDVVGDVALRTAIGDAIRDHCIRCASYFAQVVTVGAAFVSPLPPVIEFRVTFRDGVSFKLRWEYPSRDLRYVSGSARTPGGQLVPDAAPQPGETYTFYFGGGYADSLFFGTDMIEYMRRWFEIVGRIGGDDFLLVCVHRRNAPPLCTIQQI